MISLCFIADTEIASGFLYMTQLATITNASEWGLDFLSRTKQMLELYIEMGHSPFKSTEYYHSFISFNATYQCSW
jgi:hypothetical protein